MRTYDYIRCSGSGNRFLLFDTLHSDPSGPDIAVFVREASRRFDVDGILLLTHDGEGRFGMRMFNTDGSEAGMCGNGIRCAARLAHERHAAGDTFAVVSGGRPYRITREEPIFDRLPTFGAEIPLALHGGDFPSAPSEGFIGRTIPTLDAELRFTFLAPGNPHIVAAVDARSRWLFGRDGRLNLDRLAALGERANRLSETFPHGVNVSLYCLLSPQRLFAATYERGVGLTSSCGTAMTSCATAAALSGLCEFGRETDIWNRGGRVRCLPQRTPQGLVTRLTGNAAFETSGTLRFTASNGIEPASETPLDPPDYRRMADETARALDEHYALQITDHHA